MNMISVKKYSRWLFFIVIFLLIVDFVAARVLVTKDNLKIRTYHPYYHHGFKPNMQGVEPWGRLAQTFHYNHIATNSLGLRDRKVGEVPLKDSKKRIVFIGDSFTEGVLINNFDQTFAGLFANSISDASVLNAGVASYGAMLYYYKIDYLINKVGLEFDELYVFYDNSDVSDDYGLAYKDNFIPSENESLSHIIGRTVGKFLYNNSFVYFTVSTIHNYRKYIRFDDKSMWAWDAELTDDWGKKGLTTSQSYMLKLADLCRSKNIKMVLVVYPWPIHIQTKDIHSRLVQFWSGFARENNIDLLNLFPLFITAAPAEEVLRKYFFPGDIHWNEAGHKLVADKILEYYLAAHSRSYSPK